MLEVVLGLSPQEEVDISRLKTQAPKAASTVNESNFSTVVAQLKAGSLMSKAAPPVAAGKAQP